MARSIGLDLLGTGAQAQPRDYAALAGTFPYRPTLFVGLGGTGSQAVSKVKKLFLTYVTPQLRARQRADVPDIDKLYSFLAFDTNKGERPQDPPLDENREWFHLGVKDLKRFYAGIGQTAFFQSWVVPNYPANNIMAGASGFRNLGRLAFISNAHVVAQALGQARQQIGAAAAGVRTVNATPIVYVFSSVAGGTGSGTFLDLAFLLREIFGGCPITGLLGVLGGLPSMPAVKRRETQVNAAAALKELNAFMTRTAEGVKFGERIDYTGGAIGLVTEPFDECYLVSSGRQDSASSLPTQGHVSSFLARWAFMMSAYSFPGARNTPDYSGIMVNYANRLTDSAAGARTCYLVPGLAQVHFPVQAVADLFVIESTRAYIRHQTSGHADEGDYEARQFVEKTGLSFRSLRADVSKNPRALNADLEARRYDDEVADLFKGPRTQRRDQILALGRKMGSARLKDVELSLKPNVERLYAQHWATIDSAIASSLVSEKHLGKGALDLLRDLGGTLETERSYLAKEGEKLVDADFEELGRKWRAVETVVDDVLTASGPIDRFLGSFKVGRAQALLVTYLNESEDTVLRKARNELTKALFSRLIDAVGEQTARLQRLLETDLVRADKLLEQREREINTMLFDQTEASDASVENIGSVNVMSQTWREAYLRQYGFTAAQVLSSLLSRDWHPRRLLSLEAPEGKEKGAVLAQSLVDLIEPLYSELATWTPATVLQRTAGVSHEKPTDLVAKVCAKNLQPQMEISAMGSNLGAPPFELVFTAGLDDATKDALEKEGKFGVGVLQTADNQEANRITFSKVTMPVALAGCDLVSDVLEDAYDRWMDDVAKKGKKDQESQHRLFHCFPESHLWPSPTRFSHERDEVTTLFARALAVSEMLEVVAEDLARMQAVAKNPKTPRYALFQHGESQWWIWPFYTPKSPEGIKGAPIKLGSNVSAAHKALSSQKAWQDMARAWTTWFKEDGWGDLSPSQVHELRGLAVKSFATRKGKTDDPDHRSLWDEIMAAVEDWEIG